MLLGYLQIQDADDTEHYRRVVGNGMWCGGGGGGETGNLPLNQHRIFPHHFVDKRRLGERVAAEPGFEPAPIIYHGEDQVRPGLFGPERIDDCWQ